MSQVLTVGDLLLLLKQVHGDNKTAIMEDYLKQIQKSNLDKGFKFTPRNEAPRKTLITLLLTSAEYLSKSEMSQLANTTFNSVTTFLKEQKIFHLLEKDKPVSEDRLKKRTAKAYRIDLSKPVNYMNIGQSTDHAAPVKDEAEDKIIQFSLKTNISKAIHWNWSVLAEERKLKIKENNHDQTETEIVN